MDQRIRRALQILRKNYNQSLSLHRIASALSLSPSRFAHLFKQETGQTYKAFLKHRRLERAIGLLKKNYLRVKEIAQQVGYSDPVNFTHDFKKQFKHAPRVFRKLPTPSNSLKE